MTGERVVSVGFLTQRDLDVLGKGFTRHFAVADDDMFDDLLAALDKIEIEPLGKGVVMRTEQKP